MKQIIIFCILLPLFLFAQDIAPNKNTATHHSSANIEALWKKADSLSVNDPKKSTVYLNMAVALSIKADDREAQALSLNRLSSIYLQLGDVDKALEAEQKALMIYHKQPELNGYVDALKINAKLYKSKLQKLEHENWLVRKRYLSVFGFLILFVSFLFISLYQYKVSANRKLVKANSEIQHKNDELSNAYQILDLVARKDPLTNLSNRRDIIEKLKYSQITFERNHKPFSLVMTDIDFFKNINDTYGHEAGDYVLVFLAKLLQKTLRKQDIISRWGGDEFLLLLPDTDLEGGVVVGEKIKMHLEQKSCLYGKHHIKFTVSSGVTCYAAEGEIHDTIRQADEAMYASKQNGRNEVTAYQFEDSEI
ncbi:MAG TPA: diguanylate cyclase [Candidatus Cloacimonadota bacterium]|nr:diguanylate cyclase [Candidatus Cloacimonadota bacterium]